MGRGRGLVVLHFSGAVCHKMGESFSLGRGSDSHKNYDVRLGKTQRLLTNFVWSLLQGRAFTVS